ncbi:MAG: hypothetical protein ACI8PZ_005090 [Myxococcota bacterium]|jgi:hypothetical protein
MPADPPLTLHTEGDLDGLRITLGPARKPLLRPGVTVFLGLGLVGASVAVLAGSVAAAVSIGAASQLAALVYRMRRWRRHEAPLRLILTPHQLVLRRQFRRRVLHESALPLSTLVGCEVLPGGLRIVGESVSVSVSTHFRSQADLQWTADAIERAIADARADGGHTADDAALAALDAIRGASRSG